MNPDIIRLIQDRRDEYCNLIRNWLAAKARWREYPDGDEPKRPDVDNLKSEIDSLKLQYPEENSYCENLEKNKFKC
jgi:hypothetical protein